MEFEPKPEVEVEEEKSIAENTVDMIFDHYHLEVVDIDDDNEQSALKTGRNKLIRAAENGLLTAEVDEMSGDLTIVQKLVRTPKGGLKELRFKELDANMYCNMKNCKDNDLYGKIYLMLAASCGISVKLLKTLKHPDLTTAQQLGLVFIQI